ncbi:molybdopterin-synthase adenylyltransferase MoeB [Candidatus Chlorohelix sp.]|uniref:molybdopterin-synthase adenylyltransferase MoeB n=1 Tax=Candidatus Chlorohelix sp. TaxID=3139201 RepID=UPI0030509C36
MANSYNELLKRTKAQIRETTVAQTSEVIKADKSVWLVDVREKYEWDEGYIPGALHVARGFLESKIEETVSEKNAPIILYCAGGVRSAFAAKTLHEMGYTNVSSMIGGYNAWKNAGYPIAKPRNLTKEQQKRYSRHFLLPEVGEKGQLKLLDTKALLIGAGGLGAPNAFYLAAAGIGTLGIIDNDVVEESNLQRQIIHTQQRVGQYKADSAAQAIADLNPDVRVVVYKERLTAENIERILPDYDLVVDGTDNFETRYLVNDFAVKYRKPVVHASILSFNGQLTTLIPFEGPCYRCIYPDPPPAAMAPNCSEAGVLGVLPGVIGLLQANEALKLALGIGETLAGRFLLFDALEAEFTSLKLRRDPKCVACGEHADIDDLLEQHRRGDVLIPACNIR